MSDNFSAVVGQLANAKKPVCVTAAAGCGKTEAIVRAVALVEGKQLILTHTNAGVAALRTRLRKYAIPESNYRVDTIDSWLLKYAAAYVSMSGLENIHPQGDDWGNVRTATSRLLGYPFIMGRSSD
jgi:DNA helicase-2/ATP-dependent DNA helicase PcrA